MRRIRSKNCRATVKKAGRGRDLLAVLALSLPLVLAAEAGLAHGRAATAGPRQAAEPAAPTHWWWRLLHGTARAKAQIRISRADGFRHISADGLPSHRTGRFPNQGNPHAIRTQDYAFRVPLRPRRAGRPIPLGHQPFGIALNGVVFDPLTAEYWHNDRSSGWNVEALSGKVHIGLDRNNAHVQPNGAYHYHGVPTGLLGRYDFRHKPVLLGYAADGFPIYGPFGHHRGAAPPGDELVELRPGWRLKKGLRKSGPGGLHDGSYVQDYEYVDGAGDLDRCNGRQGVTPEYPEGTYHYVLTRAFPHIPRCFMAPPDPSFQRQPRRPGATGRSGPGRDGRPDLAAAAERLGVTPTALRRALGPLASAKPPAEPGPPPDFQRAARELGVSVQKLMRALRPPR
ncbi:MAG: YHYH protein [Alphaproteobacteria bacterium]|nr:YHYH protein [Alphaproteobacteria bacterium]